MIFHGFVYILIMLVQLKGRCYLLLLMLTLSSLMYVAVVTSTTFHIITIEKLRMFPLVSDNGAVFTSDKFEIIMKFNGIRYFESTPYHSLTTGLAKCALQTLKESLKKSNKGSLEKIISCSVFKYCTVHVPQLLFLQQSSTRADSNAQKYNHLHI